MWNFVPFKAIQAHGWSIAPQIPGNFTNFSNIWPQHNAKLFLVLRVPFALNSRSVFCNFLLLRICEHAKRPKMNLELDGWRRRGRREWSNMKAEREKSRLCAMGWVVAGKGGCLMVFWRGILELKSQKPLKMTRNWIQSDLRGWSDELPSRLWYLGSVLSPQSPGNHSKSFSHQIQPNLRKISWKFQIFPPTTSWNVENLLRMLRKWFCSNLRGLGGEFSAHLWFLGSDLSLQSPENRPKSFPRRFRRILAKIHSKFKFFPRPRLKCFREMRENHC